MALTQRAQTIVEYTLLVSMVMVALYYMGTGIKRGVQSLVKITADQVGNQQNADQDFNDTRTGYMISSDLSARQNKGRQVDESGYFDKSGKAAYRLKTVYDESDYTEQNTISNGGFTAN